VQHVIPNKLCVKPGPTINKIRDVIQFRFAIMVRSLMLMVNQLQYANWWKVRHMKMAVIWDEEPCPLVYSEQHITEVSIIPSSCPLEC
jgi:hypothetical protein